jgi:hypothetical protein
MKQWLGILALLIFVPWPAFARQGVATAAQQRIHAAKMAYITDRLKLSVEQSTGFIPVYNDYEQEGRQIRRKYMGKYKDVDVEHADDATSLKYIDDNLEYQQQVLDLKRRYNDKFLKTISAQQLAELNVAEREFRQLLLQRLKQRRQEGGGGRRRGR